MTPPPLPSFHATLSSVSQVPKGTLKFGLVTCHSYSESVHLEKAGPIWPDYNQFLVGLRDGVSCDNLFNGKILTPNNVCLIQLFLPGWNTNILSVHVYRMCAIT